MKKHPEATLGKETHAGTGERASNAPLTGTLRFQLLWVATFSVYVAARLTLGPAIVSTPAVWAGSAAAVALTYLALLRWVRSSPAVHALFGPLTGALP